MTLRPVTCLDNFVIDECAAVRVNRPRASADSFDCEPEQVDGLDVIQLCQLIDGVYDQKRIDTPSTSR